MKSIFHGKVNQFILKIKKTSHFFSKIKNNLYLCKYNIKTMKSAKPIFVALLCLVAQIAAAQAVVAHRGYWKAASGAQNSLQAYALADSVGAYASEFDVWLTAADSLVVNHDRHFGGVDFLTGSTDSILAITLKNGEPLPTLDAYLAQVAAHPGIRPVLELKHLGDMVREDLAAAMVVEALAKHGLLDSTDVISFSLNACLAFRKLAPSLPVYYLDGDLPPRKLAELGFAGLDYNGSVLKAHPEWVDDAHKRGLKVNVWTIDRPDDMRLFKSMGVDFITTNEPALLLQIIGEGR